MNGYWVLKLAFSLRHYVFVPPVVEKHYGDHTKHASPSGKHRNTKAPKHQRTMVDDDSFGNGPRSNRRGGPPPLDSIPATISMDPRQRQLSLNFLRAPTSRTSGGGMVRMQGHRVTTGIHGGNGNGSNSFNTHMNSSTFQFDASSMELHIVDTGSVDGSLGTNGASTAVTGTGHHSNQPDRYVLDDMEGSVSMGSILSLNTPSGEVSMSSVVEARPWYLSWFSIHRRRHKTSLRRQILLRYGLLSCVLVAIFVVTAIFSSTYDSRSQVLQFSQDYLDEWLVDQSVETAQSLGDIVAERLGKLDGMLRLVQIVTQERLAGYPNANRVPFVATDGSNTYPWKAQSVLPIVNGDDIVVVPDGSSVSGLPSNGGSSNAVRSVSINSTNVLEYFQTTDRYEWDGRPSSLIASAVLTTTSVSNESDTFTMINEKVSDFASPLLKSLYEHHHDVRSLQVHFINDGFGGMDVHFPSTTVLAADNGSDKFDSGIGCDWLRLPNPVDPSQPIGTEQQRQNCHQAGRGSILQQDWCRTQSLYPDEYHYDGPFRRTGGTYFRLGKAIYDTETQQLLACTSVHVHAQTFGQLDGFQGDAEALFGRGHLLVLDWIDNAILSGVLPELETSRRVVEEDRILHLDDLGLSWTPMLEDAKLRFLEQYRNDEPIVPISIQQDGWSMSVYPSPPPPERSARSLSTSTERPRPFWRPQMMVGSIVHESARDGHLHSLRDSLRDQTRVLVRKILISGFVSMIILLLILFVLSLCLTVPLAWMHTAGKHILASVGNSHNFASDVITTMSYTDDLDMEYQHRWWYRISPRTEVIKLAEEFKRMVEQCSGQGIAKLFKQQLLEVKNPFTLYENFKKQYERRMRGRLSYDYSSVQQQLRRQASMGEDVKVPESLLSEQSIQNLRSSDDSQSLRRSSDSLNFLSEYRLHIGPNVRNIDATADLNKSVDDDDLLENHEGQKYEEHQTGSRQSRLYRCLPRWCRPRNTEVLKSALFRWIFGSVALPLIFMMIGISVYILLDLRRTLPTLVDIADDLYAVVGKNSLFLHAQMRTLHVSEIVQTSLRDLHVMNRMAGWLLTGAIPLTASTTLQVSMAAESCKQYNPTYHRCPVTLERTCDCAWEDPWDTGCQAHSSSQRLSQRIAFEGLSEDAFPNGDRNFTSFPDVGKTPRQT